MAHPQHVKTTKLNALLIGKRTVPSGCRVLTVSQQGMSLQCDPDGRLLTFTNGDSVDIYLSVQHNNGHNKFTIPAIVSHADESTIDVVFHCTDPELAGLIESYRTSESHNLEASIDHRQVNRDESATEPVAFNASISSDPQAARPVTRSSLSFYTGLFALFFTSLVLIGAYYYISSINARLNLLETVTGSQANKLADVQTHVFSSRLQDGRYASLNARMKALTDAFQSFEKRVTVALLQDPASVITGAPEIPGEKPVTVAGARNAPVDTAEPVARKKVAPVSPPEKKIPKAATSPAPDKQAATITATAPSVEEPQLPSVQKYPAIESQPDTPAVTTPPRETPQIAHPTIAPVKTATHSTTPSPAIKAEPPLATRKIIMPETASVPVTKPVVVHTGPWVINLLSSIDKADVEKARANAQSLGIDAVVKSATVKGRQYWRLQVPGFGSMSEAKTAAEPIKQQLKIKAVWIFKRKH